MAPGVDGVEGVVERAEVDYVIAAERGGRVDGRRRLRLPEERAVRVEGVDGAVLRGDEDVA